jgi:hypothetical protein
MGRWSRLLVFFALAVFASLLPREAQAHPLGNFTINHYSRLEFADGKAHLDYVLDFAEIPTFQQKGKLDPNGDGKLTEAEARAYLDASLPSLVKNLHLKVGNEKLPLRVLHSSATYRPGQGGLPILRVEARLLADLPEDWQEHGSGHYADRNYRDRLGWREIVVKGGPGIYTKDSTAPSSGVSDELRRYPQDMLSSPLDVREARFTLVPGGGPAAGDTPGNLTTGDYSFGSNGYVGRLYGWLNSLISLDSPSPTVILISLLAALSWGAVHAFTPGHGKTVVAAYLIGDRGTARHAAFLGLTVTLTHTVGVFALGGWPSTCPATYCPKPSSPGLASSPDFWWSRSASRSSSTAHAPWEPRDRKKRNQDTSTTPTPTLTKSTTTPMRLFTPHTCTASPNIHTPIRMVDTLMGILMATTRTAICRRVRMVRRLDYAAWWPSASAVVWCPVRRRSSFY